MIDLHVHSNVSDGTFSPSELVDIACRKGITVMALTDHDSVQGVKEALDRAAELRSHGKNINVIPGIEISAAYESRDIHILGYYVDINNKEFLDLMENAWAERCNRNEIMALKFRKSGIPMTTEALTALSGSEVITRAHFAKWLVQNKYCKTNAEAFDKYLGAGCPYYVPREYLSREVAVKAIIKAGGVPVLAHPMLYGLNPPVSPKLEELVIELKGYGLKGLETYYSSNMGNDEDIVRHLALKHDLIMTGGSDFHGDNKPGLEMGSGRNNSLNVPYSAYRQMAATAGKEE